MKEEQFKEMMEVLREMNGHMEHIKQVIDNLNWGSSIATHNRDPQ